MIVSGNGPLFCAGLMRHHNLSLVATALRHVGTSRHLLALTAHSQSSTASAPGPHVPMDVDRTGGTRRLATPVLVPVGFLFCDELPGLSTYLTLSCSHLFL